MNHVKRLAVAGILIAVGVVCSPLAIPVGASKCFPVQHMINVLAGILLGPAYAVGMAFVTSLLRVLLGMGTLLAFPGSMLGALCCGLLYRYTRKLPLAYAGEIAGTSLLGGLAAYPLAVFMMGKEAAIAAYVLPFFISTAGGATIAILFLAALKKTKAFDLIERTVSK
ncbi:MAG: energy coupling factor transporter S component ThiW [Clostridiales bacterium]|jgi:energy coupling factor transporter S component ThiW|nr:energy coupling factor transporter S component ThiW [Clostridiales bacterium]